MEEIAQIIFELFGQLLVELLADALWRRFPEPALVLTKAFLIAAAAALLGGLSTVILPAALIGSHTLRVAYLIVAPALIAAAMTLVGRYFAGKDQPRSSLEKIGFGWLFAFSFALTRYLLTK